MEKKNLINSAVGKIEIHWTLKIAAIIVLLLTLIALIDSQFDFNFIDYILGLFDDKTSGVGS